MMCCGFAILMLVCNVFPNLPFQKMLEAVVGLACCAMVEVVAPAQNEQVQILYHLLYTSEMDYTLLRQLTDFASEAFRRLPAGIEVCDLFAMPLLVAPHEVEAEKVNPSSALVTPVFSDFNFR